MEVNRIKFKSVKKGFRQRKKSLDVDESAEIDELQSKLENTKELQKLRLKGKGVSLDALNSVHVDVNDTKVLKDPFKLKNGGLVDMKSKEDKEEELSLGSTFSAETNRTDEDSYMMKYVEEGLAKRKNEHSRNEVEKRGKFSTDELYEVPDNLQISSSKISEEMMSNQMLMGIPEVDLGIEVKMRNIEETEEAKYKLLRDQRNKRDGPSKFVPSNMAVNFVHHQRFSVANVTKLNKRSDKVEGEDKKDQVATDDVYYEKFKKQFRQF